MLITTGTLVAPLFNTQREKLLETLTASPALYPLCAGTSMEDLVDFALTHFGETLIFGMLSDLARSGTVKRSVVVEMRRQGLLEVDKCFQTQVPQKEAVVPRPDVAVELSEPTPRAQPRPNPLANRKKK